MKSWLTINKLFVFYALIIIVLWFYLLINLEFFSEWDGIMHYYSGLQFWKDGIYTGWASHYWPPLQPIILSIGDPLITGKIISIGSGFVIIYSIKLLGDLNKLKSIESFKIILAVCSSSLFLINFSEIENHALETALFLLGITIFLYSEKFNSIKLLVFSAIIVAFAGLTRYSSYIIPLVIFIYLITKGGNNKFFKIFVFSFSFILVSSVWWIPNFLMNGSPLATWQYLNLGLNLNPRGRLNWLWIDHEKFNNLADIIKVYPIEFLKNIVKNFTLGIFMVFKNLTSSKYLSAFLIVIFLYFNKNLTKIKSFFLKNLFFISLSFFYLLLCSLAFVFDEALLPISILTMYILYFQLIKINRINSIFFIIIISLNIVLSKFEIDKLLVNRSDHYGQLPEVNEIKKIIDSKKNNKSVIISINPAVAYYFDIKWIGFPLAGANDICDVVNYNYSKKTINLSPKIPFDLNLNDNPIDFILITKDLDKIHGFINGNLDFERDKCGKKRFTLLYKSSKASLWQVVYK